MNTTKILATIGGTLIIICLAVLTFTYSAHMFTANASAPNTVPTPAPTSAPNTVPTPAPTSAPKPAAPIIVQAAPPIVVQSAPPVIIQQPAPPVAIQQSAPTLDSPLNNFVARYGAPFQNPYGQTCFWYDSSQIVNICIATDNSGLVTWIQAGDNDVNVTGADTDQNIANFIINRSIYQYMPTDGTTYTVTADGLNSTTMTH